MEMVGISLGYRGAEGVPVMRTPARAAEAKTSSGASQATTMVAIPDEYWWVATDGNIWVETGTAPTAAAGAGFMLTAGTYAFEAIAGDKLAIIDA